MPAHIPLGESKICSKCKGDLPLDAFGASKNAKHGKNSWCKVCRNTAAGEWLQKNKQKGAAVRRAYKLKTKYGISQDQYAAMVAAQSGKCALCGNDPHPRKNLDVDHCHFTGRVRGLLCRSCNKSLGLLRESPSVISRAIAYLDGTLKFDQGTAPCPYVSSEERSRMLYRYGLAKNDYCAFYTSQGGVCAICEQACDMRNNLSIDHSHETSKVRGLLCAKCNTAIGSMNENTVLLSAAILYLQKTPV